MERLTDATGRSDAWRWSVCGLLLAATMLNYMDRQTLSLTITDISNELELSNEQYGDMEFGFGMAFALGGIITGLLVDRLRVRWMYPAVLIGWSLAGIATAHAVAVGRILIEFSGELLEPDPGVSADSHAAYVGLVACRLVLGFFEAGQWPCALVTTQRILSQRERPFGNSLLQSGASVGAILTPLVVLLLVTNEPGSWRAPFEVIGGLGMLWVVPWFLLVRSGDLDLPVVSDTETARSAPKHASDLPEHRGRSLLIRLLVLTVVVVMINMTWQYFRAWLPKLLREFHGYDETSVALFVSAYFIATDVGCIGAGLAVRQLSRRGWGVHSARLATFGFCALLTSLSTIAAVLPRGPFVLALLLLIGVGALGLFPIYYSLTQDLSARHQGKVTGLLGTLPWIMTSIMQKYVGRSVDATGSYALGIFCIGLAPLVALLTLWLFWPGGEKPAASPSPENTEEPASAQEMQKRLGTEKV